MTVVSDFEKIYMENARLVLKYLLSLTKNYDVAEELTQETFFRAYQNIDTFKGTCKLNVWLCQIAKNLFINWLNKESRVQCIDDLIEVPHHEVPEKKIFEKEGLEQLYRAIHALKEPYKEVFLLHYNGDITLKEIGQLFGKSESWARVTYYRSKEQLRQWIEKEGKYHGL